jgi:Uma2 family endonuclease
MTASRRPGGIVRAHAHQDFQREQHPMHMAAIARKWTLAELHRLPDDRNKYELVRGELIVTPPPTPPHEGLSVKVGRIVQSYVEAHDLGEIFRPRAVVRLEDSQVEPDLAVRLMPLPLPKRWEDMPAPILIVEVLSKSTRRRDLLQKRALYLDNGIPTLWLFDPKSRSVRVARPGQPDEVVTDQLVWHPEGASEPLIVDVAAIFALVLGPAD